MADDSSLDKILDRLPYSDGTGRRRFVAGGILLIGTIIIFFENFKGFFEGKLEVTDFLGSPIILLAAVLILYALGNLTEMIAGLFLVRMASGVMWTVGFPHRASRQVSNCYMRWIAYGGLIVLAPFYMVWEMIRGLRGDTRFRLPLESDLTPKALELLDTLPPKVRSGLYHPVSNDAEYSTKYMIDSFTIESDRRWARRLLGQADDVSSVTTAFILIALLVFTTQQISQSGGIAVFGLSDDEKDVVLKFRSKYIDIDRALEDVKPADAANKIKMCVEAISRKMSTLPDSPKRTDEIARTIDRAALDFSQCMNTNLTAAVTARKKSESIEWLEEVVDSYGELSEAVSRLDRMVIDRLSKARNESNFKSAITTLLLSVVFLFLYVGYFKTLHNAVVNIIEASLLSSGPINKAEDAGI